MDASALRILAGDTRAGDGLDLHAQARCLGVNDRPRVADRVSVQSEEDSQDKTPAHHDLLDVEDLAGRVPEGIEERRCDSGPIAAAEDGEEGAVHAASLTG